MSEWAYGVGNWFEAGLYLPLYSVAGTGALTYNGFKVRTLFVKPDAANLAYNFNKTWAIAAEEYDDFGPVRRFYSPSQQQHQLFGVFDFGGRPWSVEGGFGVGLTGASDHLVLKLILSRDLAW